MRASIVIELEETTDKQVGELKDQVKKLISAIPKTRISSNTSE